MKQIVIFLFCLICAFDVFAKVDRSMLKTDQLKVLKIVPANSDVRAGGQRLSGNQLFKASQNLSWDADFKYIEVYNLRTNVKFRFCSKEFTSEDYSLYNAYVKRNSTNGKGISEDNAAIEDMRRVFDNNRLYMIGDEIFINSSLINDKTHYFELTAGLDNGYMTTIPLPYNLDESYTIYISKEYLLKYGVDITLGPIRFVVKYITPNEDYNLTNYLYIEYVNL